MTAGTHEASPSTMPRAAGGEVPASFDTAPADANGHGDELNQAAAGDVAADAPPETGDLVIDAALRDLAEAQGGDLDARIAAGERVQATLRSRLSDRGG